MPGTPLGILDLVPVPSGSTAADALRNSIDLARHAERLGYTRYWFAEHHLNPGVAGTSPAILLALTASATSTIRLGSGAVQLGHRTALSTVEEFGLIDALHPGRLDLGLGRSGAPRRGTASPGAPGGAAGEGRASGTGPGGEPTAAGRVSGAVRGEEGRARGGAGGLSGEERSGGAPGGGEPMVEGRSSGLVRGEEGRVRGGAERPLGEERSGEAPGGGGLTAESRASGVGAGEEALVVEGPASGAAPGKARTRGDVGRPVGERASGAWAGEEGRGDRGVAGAGASRRGPVVGGRAPNGLLVPPPFSFEAVLKLPRFALQRGLLQLPGARSQGYAGQIDDLLALLAGTYRSADGEEAHVVPGEGAGVEVWILGSSGGESAEVAGARGLRFAANYHVSPASVLDAVDAYREHFEPSAALDRPYVSVSADVVVAEDEARARELATGYPLWVRSIRTAEGAIPFPTPEEARAHTLTDEDRALVQDRVDTQFVGTAAQVADRLEQLQEATEADELLVTTITHDHTDRVHSYRLLAREWARRGHSAESS